MDDAASIDFGTGFTSFAFADGTGNPEVGRNEAGELQTESVFFVPEEGDGIVIGSEAKNLAALDPGRAIFYPKRELGTDKVLFRCEKSGRELRAQALAEAMFRHAAKLFEKATGNVLARVFISKPANFAQAAKRSLIAAAEAASLQVVLSPEEPTAAAVGSAIHKRGGGHYLVIDLGCGTLDVSVLLVEGDTVTVKCTEGVERLGGMDYSEAVSELVLSAFEKEHRARPNEQEEPVAFGQLRSQVETAKALLSKVASATIVFTPKGEPFSYTLTREAYLAATSELTERALDCTERALADAEVSTDLLREIIPAGGGTLSYGFKEAVERRLGRAPAEYADPQFAVVRGGFLLGRAELERSGEKPEVRGQSLPPLSLKSGGEVTAHALGVAVTDDGVTETCAVLLKKGSTYPLIEKRTFRLHSPGDTGCSILMLEGIDGAAVSTCKKLGEFSLTGLPQVYNKAHPIEVTMSYDRNGIATVHARCPLSGKEDTLEVSHSF